VTYDLDDLDLRFTIK